MKHALVVKALTDQILLVRTDCGDLLSLSVPCGTFSAGSLLQINTEQAGETGCVILSANGNNCNNHCKRESVAVVIEHKDSTAASLQLTEESERRNVI